MVVFRPTATLGLSLKYVKAQRNLCGEGYQYGQVLAQYGTLPVPGSQFEAPYFLTVAQGSLEICGDPGIEKVVGHPRVHGIRATLWCAGTTCRGTERFYSVGWCEQGTQIAIGGGSKVTPEHLIRVARSTRALPGGTSRACS